LSKPAYFEVHPQNNKITINHANGFKTTFFILFFLIDFVIIYLFVIQKQFPFFIAQDSKVLTSGPNF